MSIFINNTKALFIAPPNSSASYKKLVDQCAGRVGITPFQVDYRTAKPGWLKKKSKTTYTWDEDKRQEFDDLITKEKYALVIINDKASLGFITNRYTSVACCRGSIIYYKVSAV